MDGDDDSMTTTSNIETVAQSSAPQLQTQQFPTKKLQLNAPIQAPAAAQNQDADWFHLPHDNMASQTTLYARFEQAKRRAKMANTAEKLLVPESSTTNCGAVASQEMEDGEISTTEADQLAHESSGNFQNGNGASPSGDTPITPSSTAPEIAQAAEAIPVRFSIQTTAPNKTSPQRGSQEDSARRTIRSKKLMTCERCLQYSLPCNEASVCDQCVLCKTACIHIWCPIAALRSKCGYANCVLAHEDHLPLKPLDPPYIIIKRKLPRRNAPLERKRRPDCDPEWKDMVLDMDRVQHIMKIKLKNTRTPDTAPSYSVLLEQANKQQAQ